MEKINDTAERIRQCNARQGASRSEWIAATLEKAQLFATERARMPDNRAFAVWLVDNEIEESKDDRAAYIEIGENVDAWRTIIECCDSASVRMIVADHRASAEKLISLRSAAKNETVEPYSEEQPEIEPETPVSIETAAENTEIKVEIREPQPVHRGMLKTIGEDDAAFVSNFYISGNGVAKGMISDISKLNDGPRAVRKLIKELKTGLYGEFSTATTNKKELYPLMFVPGLPQKWSPPKFPTKATPASLSKIIDMMPMMKAVADTLAAEPRKPPNLSDFCTAVWRRLAQEAHNARKAAEPAKEAPAEPVQARPVLTVVSGSVDGRLPLAPGEDRLEAHGIVFWPPTRSDAEYYSPTYLQVQQAIQFCAQVQAKFFEFKKAGNALCKELNFFANQIAGMGAARCAVMTIKTYAGAVMDLPADQMHDRAHLKAGYRAQGS